MKQVWKYSLKIEGRILHLPVGARILSVGAQNGAVFLWAEVDTEAKRSEPRLITVYRTGQPLADPVGHYLGTVITETSAFHVYEEGRIMTLYLVYADHTRISSFVPFLVGVCTSKEKAVELGEYSIGKAFDHYFDGANCASDTFRIDELEANVFDESSAE